jgi:hypothetical protein
MALVRSAIADYEVHEQFQVDTQDNEDHTFCGIMVRECAHPLNSADNHPLVCLITC